MRRRRDRLRRRRAENRGRAVVRFSAAAAWSNGNSRGRRAGRVRQTEVP